jgi:AraC-like DNA-binding protein
MTDPDPLLERWSFATTEPNTTVVLPDGCRDLIGRLESDGRTTWWLTDWVDAAYIVNGVAGQAWVGYRLRPGVYLKEKLLKSQIESLGDTPLDTDMRNLLADHAAVDDNSASALQALAVETRVSVAARSLGVSERTLHRTVLQTTAKPPSYWLQLARVRRAARALRTTMPLVELATTYGYADQAHLSRSMRQWFGHSPEKMRQMPQYLDGLDFSGYA